MLIFLPLPQGERLNQPYRFPRSHQPPLSYTPPVTGWASDDWFRREESLVMSVVTCGGCYQGARAAMDATHPSKRLPRWAANGSAAWLKLKNPSASAGGLARRPAFEDQGRMSPCLAELDGSRWRSAVFLNYQSGRRVSVALRKQLPGNKGRRDRPEANSGEVFPGGFGVA